MIGSSTKPITTLLMATLVANGGFHWSTRVREILPDFTLAHPEIADRLGMRHTVCACTGWAPGDAALFFRFKGVSPEQRVSEMSTVNPRHLWENHFNTLTGWWRLRLGEHLPSTSRRVASRRRVCEPPLHDVRHPQRFENQTMDDLFKNILDRIARGGVAETLGRWHLDR